MELSLFSSIICIFIYSARSHSNNNKNVIIKSINHIESIVQRDEGNRGIKDLIKNPILYDTTTILLDANINIKSVIILTGFPCLINNPCPQETDGPLGCMALARTLALLNKKVTLVTDSNCINAVRHCADGSGIFNLPSSCIKPQIECFSAVGNNDMIMTKIDQQRLQNLKSNHDCVIAIERAGPNKDGRYLTMSKKHMNHLLAPLEKLFLNNDGNVDNSNIKRPITIGIGDGGNEVGMGSVFEEVTTSKKIPNSDSIACTTPANYLLACSVSNWGGYALAGALTLLSASIDGAIRSDEALLAHVNRCYPSNLEETETIKALTQQGGACDGVTGKNEMTVDGFSWDKNLEVLSEIRDVILSHSHSQ